MAQKVLFLLNVKFIYALFFFFFFFIYALLAVKACFSYFLLKRSEKQHCYVVLDEANQWMLKF